MTGQFSIVQECTLHYRQLIPIDTVQYGMRGRQSIVLYFIYNTLQVTWVSLQVMQLVFTTYCSILHNFPVGLAAFTSKYVKVFPSYCSLLQNYHVMYCCSLPFALPWGWMSRFPWWKVHSVQTALYQCMEKTSAKQSDTALMAMPENLYYIFHSLALYSS